MGRRLTTSSPCGVPAASGLMWGTLSVGLTMGEIRQPQLTYDVLVEVLGAESVEENLFNDIS